MKEIIWIGLITLIYSYNTAAAVDYARTYCQNYNPRYKNYERQGGDCANFVSQCLIAGGIDLSGCYGNDKAGSIPNGPNLKSCLKQLGWKSSTTRPSSFRPGYPIFLGDYRPVICSSIDGDTIYYCAHSIDRCDSPLNMENVLYYYL